ncbi:MAG: sigma-E factor negative regulatory protein [Methylococcales bacterium]|nr:sigma-E factor negative regulatory protein [Methylococcales bacterium]
MPEDLNQKISQFLDNELDHEEALALLQKMQTHSELQDKMNRYESISHALKTDFFLMVQSDLSSKISLQIQQEPIHFLPQIKPINRDYKIIALAASIAVVAVIAGQNINHQTEQNKAAPVLYAKQQSASKTVAYAHQAEQLALNARINEYLQAHNSSVYTNGEANFQPFAKVTAYSQK